VGCIPSKALLHVAAVMDEVKHLEVAGVKFAAPEVNIDQLRGHKEKVIGKLTGGLGQMAKMRKVTVVRGYGNFVSPTTSKWKKPPAPARKRPAARRSFSSRTPSSLPARRPCACPSCPRTPRGRFHRRAGLKEVPKRMLILGGGIIGLEMGTVYSTLGARLDVVEMMDGLMQGADRDLVKVWQKMNAPRFDNIMVNTKTVGAEATPEGIKVTFAPAKDGVTVPEPQTYDLVLQAVGRTPNGKKIAPTRPAWP
jgi:dihydrolipoamide dehydrogenase